MRLLSVIMPMYNVEKYVVEAVDSVLNEGYEPMELIIVNDGSKDSSRALIERYEGDARVVIIDKENTGVADSRNRAIDIARGEYITFIDSDDAIAEGSYSSAIDYLDSNPNIDIVDFPTLLRWGSKRASCRKSDSENHLYSSRREMFEGFRKSCISGAAWNKIFRREVIGDCRFSTTVSTDDVYFTVDVLSRCRALYHINQGHYKYRRTPHSILTKGRTVRFMQGWIETRLHMYECAKREGVNIPYNSIGCYNFLLSNCKGFTNEERAELMNRLFTEEEQRKLARRSLLSKYTLTRIAENIVSLKNEPIGENRYKVLRLLGCRVLRIKE